MDKSWEAQNITKMFIRIHFTFTFFSVLQLHTINCQAVNDEDDMFDYQSLSNEASWTSWTLPEYDNFLPLTSPTEMGDKATYFSEGIEPNPIPIHGVSRRFPSYINTIFLLYILLGVIKLC